MYEIRPHARGTVDEVVEEAKHLCGIGGAGGPIACSSTGRMDTSMPFENIPACFGAIHTYEKF